MTLKEELEILRGEPIRVFTGEPLDIPCIETSESEKLCKHPVVSVQMITYNHEPYIRQAIEGVMMQKTDFEFELVIGEDASTDKTREICFEYQRRYPDKIRVLWANENVNNNGGNGCRVRARCRGEFIAFCEGDDYWTDPQKLQRQVETFRAHPNLALAMTGGQLLYDGALHRCAWFDGRLTDGLLAGRDFLAKHLAKKPGFMLTASAMCRRDLLEKAKRTYGIFRYSLSLGDTTTWLALTSFGDFWWDSSETVVYRRHPGGITRGDRALIVGIDAALVRMYYENAVLGVPMWRSKFAYDALDCRLRYFSAQSFARRICEFGRILVAYHGYLWFYHFAAIVGILLFLMGRSHIGIFSANLFLGFTKKLYRIPHLVRWVMKGKRQGSRLCGVSGRV